MPFVIRPDDAALTWSGAVDVEHTGDWSRAWRLPRDRLDLFPGEGLQRRAAMSAGVRLEFGTDASEIQGVAIPPSQTPNPIANPVDLVVDGTLTASVRVGHDGRFDFGRLRPGWKHVEIWLPQAGDFRLVSLQVDHGASVREAIPATRPRMVAYGSSITQCRSAASPTRTWPAIVARDLGLDLTCLGFGGECHLDPMIARVIRDRPADIVVTCLGANVHEHGTFTERSFLPAVLGFLSTVRDGHEGVPILVISPIVSPDREDVPGPGGMTLVEIRRAVADAVRLLREHGDHDVHLLNGLDVLGPAHRDRLPDGLHPDAEGYQLMAKSITPAVQTATRAS